MPGTWVYHCHILSHVERDDGSVFGMFTALIVEDSGDPEVDEATDREDGVGRSGDGAESSEEHTEADHTATETDASTGEESSA